MEKIKLMHIITRFDKGGSAENTFLTIAGLDKERYETTLIKGLSLESDMGAQEAQAVENNVLEAEKKGIKIVTISELVRRIHPWYDFKTLMTLIVIFKKEQPHIVHTHSSKAGMLGRWAASVAKVPIIIHTPHGHVFWGYFGKWKTWVYILLEKLTAYVTDTIITLTEQEKKDHLACKIAPENKFLTVHSGVDVDAFLNVSIDPVRMKRSLGISDNAFVVGTVARLTPVKGHRYLFEAARELVAIKKDIAFVFLGDGELLPELETMTSELGIEKNVRFLGWREDVAVVMSVFDLCALPSLNEGMGRVLVEAMAMGKPIVASKVGGIPDLVKDGYNGFLVNPGDAKGLSFAIRKLLLGRKMRDEMGSRGRSMVKDFSVEKMIEKIDTLYFSLYQVKISAQERGITISK